MVKIYLICVDENGFYSNRVFRAKGAVLGGDGQGTLMSCTVLALELTQNNKKSCYYGDKFVRTMEEK